MIQPSPIAKVLLLGAGVLLAAAQAPAADVKAQIASGNIRVEFDPILHSRIVARFDGKDIQIGRASCRERV